MYKRQGNYHGHGDSFLIKAGSGAITLGLPDSPGVTKNTAKDTLIASFNDIKSVEKLFRSKANEIAAVIVEPVSGNMGLVLPNNGFLKALRKICSENEALLIFDEVMTGFRLAKGGAQEIYNVTPDITTLGKVIGGGLPVGAYGGRSEIMNSLAPIGPVYQAGTLSGNPLAMQAGLSVLKKLDNKLFQKLDIISNEICVGIQKNIDEIEINAVISRIGSMMTLFFTDKKVINNYEDAMACDTDKYAKYFKHMLDMGIYLPPSQFECCFFSSVLTRDDVKKIIKSNRVALQKLV